jgi:hypothetical protein
MDTRFGKNSSNDENMKEPASQPTNKPTDKPVEQPSFMLLTPNIKPDANDIITSDAAGGFITGATLAVIIIPIIIGMILLVVWPAVALFIRINADESWPMWILSLICAIICAPFYTAYAVIRYVSLDSFDIINNCKFSFNCK